MEGRACVPCFADWRCAGRVFDFRLTVPFGPSADFHPPEMHMMHLCSRTLELPGARRVALEEYGDPVGAPVFFCHGWPASRLQGAGFGWAARELGVRLISPDRPGIGCSTFQPERKLIDWPPLLEEIADALGLGPFRVLGISGGGPYAFAAGWGLPERVEAIAVASGAPPLPPETDPRALLFAYRWLLQCYRRGPGITRALFRCVRPFATVRPPRWLWPWLLRTVPAADAEALRDADVFEGSFQCYQESWRGSALGVVTDAEAYAQPWGFSPEEVRVPVRLWHGQGDRSFSWKLVAELARRLPNCAPHFIEGEGHYSLPIRRGTEILRDLQQCAPAAIASLGAAPANLRSC
jgi:pimeloyl-ACP methyl ester carboxylesterase